MLYPDYMTKIYIYVYSMTIPITLDEFYTMINVDDILVFPIVSKSQYNTYANDIIQKKRKPIEVLQEWFFPDHVKHVLHEK
jgi:arginine deiminase